MIFHRSDATLLLLLASLTFCPLLGAQEPVSVETRPGAVLYAIPRDVTVPQDKRFVYDYSRAKTKKVRKPVQVPVLGLANCQRTPEFDSYLVEMKGKSYFLPRDGVADAVFIDKINRTITETGRNLTDSIALCKTSLGEEYESLLQAVRTGTQANRDRARGIANNPDSILGVHIREFMAEDVLRYRQVRDRHERWVETLPEEYREITRSFAITGQELTKKASGSCNYRFSFTNLSPKSIRTLLWDGKLLDEKGNELTCQNRHVSSLSGKFSGPCPPAWPAELVSNNVARHPDAARIALSKITIMYTDKTQLELEGPVLQVLLDMPGTALPAGVRTESHFLDLNQFEIDHNQLLNNKKKVFRKELPSEKIIAEQNARTLTDLEKELIKRESGAQNSLSLLSDERFLSLLKGTDLARKIYHYEQTARTLDSLSERNARFRKENFYE